MSAWSGHLANLCAFLIGDAARGSDSVFRNFRQCHSRNYSDSRFRAKHCVSDEISKAADLDVGDSTHSLESQQMNLFWSHNSSKEIGRL